MVRRSMGGLGNACSQQKGTGLAFLFMLFALILILLAGCEQPQLLPAETPVDVVEVAQTDVETPPADGIGAPADTHGRELVLWTPEFMNADPNTSSGAILADAYERFEVDHPDTRIEVQIKAESGQANLSDYVRSAQRVAPQVLPQIILIDTQQLWRLVDLGLVPPLNQSDVTEFNTLYPFTLDAVQYQNQIYGIPFVADVMHAAYYAADFEERAPEDWGQVQAAAKPYFFPASARNGLSSDSVLMQYVGAGGELRADGVLTNPEALVTVFNFWAAGIESGMILPSALEYSTLGAVWDSFVSAGTGLAEVSANQFLSKQGSLGEIRFGSIPTRSGAPVTLGRVWAFVVLTSEPEERQLALELIRQLMAPSVHGGWSESVQRLPTQAAALAEWKNNAPYVDFLRRMLDVAISTPNGAAFRELSIQMQTASEAVLRQELAPPAAVQTIQSSR
ncbi:MAG: extracellular solute-binding protein [Caldilineaceae bacterium]|nr:extracellular solute-binding protein [Caldilineaceae bacterium]MCB0139761.1 extracellular solute-binding protein [Caldilineaceae bacterium]